MDQDYALNHIGLPDSLREKLIFLWLYDAEQAHKVYLVLNANLRGEKVQHLLQGNLHAGG